MLNKGLNPEQREAVKFKDGACLVLAGPGSGKTTVITNRVANLIATHKVDPSSILVVTFTKSAALEMQNRFRKNYYRSDLLSLSDQVYQVQFGTFHAIFYQIFQSYYHYSNQFFITREEKIQYIQYLCKKNQKNILDEYTVEDILSKFSYWKNQGIIEGSNIQSNQKSVVENPEDCVLLELYKQYNEFLKEEQKMDFDDLQIQCYELLLHNPRILEDWRKRFQYILLDEFQDISPIQYKIISLIAGRHGNLFAVGDDDQSIYSFRGADPVILQRFLEDFCAYKIVLKLNYRSCGKIVEESKLLIRENVNRLDKDYQAFSNESALNAFEIKGFERQIQQYEYFKEQMGKKENMGTCAILCRTNLECTQIQKALQKVKMNCLIQSKQTSVSKNPMVSVVKAYCEWILGNNKRKNFLQIMNIPPRGIFRSVLKEEVYEEQLLSAMDGVENATIAIQKMFQYREWLQQWKPESVVRFILKNIGVEKYFTERMEEKHADVFMISSILVQNAKMCNHLRDFVDLLGEEGKDELIPTPKEKTQNVFDVSKEIKIMTMHGSKGLEFDDVWIFSCNEGIIPHGKHLSKEQIEEERRIFYVAMTRAKQSLHLCYVKGEKEIPQEPSMFLRVFAREFPLD